MEPIVIYARPFLRRVPIPGLGKATSTRASRLAPIKPLLTTGRQASSLLLVRAFMASRVKTRRCPNVLGLPDRAKRRQTPVPLIGVPVGPDTPRAPARLPRASLRRVQART